MPHPPSSGVLNARVSLDGQPLPSGFELLWARVRHELDRVSKATLSFADGDPARQRFELAELPQLRPGALLELAAGYDNQLGILFRGRVMKVAVRMRGGRLSTELECRDAAYALDLVARDELYEQQTDSQIFVSLLERAHARGAVPETAVRHAQMVQHEATDWQFMARRAHANGLLLRNRLGQVDLLSLDPGQEPIRLEMGSDLLELDLELDASAHGQGVEAQAWKSQEQSVVAKKGVPHWPANPWLDETPPEGRPTDRPARSSNLADNELKDWADARAERLRLGQVRGSLKTWGLAELWPGQCLAVGGLGARFDGQALLVAGVEHNLREGSWTSTAHVGIEAPLPEPLPGTDALLPPWPGLAVGKVERAEGDPAGLGRVLVALPLLGPNRRVWAKLASPDAGPGRGFRFLPEPGDEVVLGFFDQDPRFPVVLGALHSPAAPPPLPPTPDNALKGIFTRAGLSLRFDDLGRVISLLTPGGQSVVLDDQGRSVLLADAQGNRIELSKDGIRVASAQKLVLEARDGIELRSPQGDIVLEGRNLEALAQARFKASGKASAEIAASGTVQIRGTAIKLN